MGGIDRALMDPLRDSRQNLLLLGASSGAWRLACHPRKDPRQALLRLEEAYIEQCFPPNPGPRFIARNCLQILESVLGDQGAGEILDHPHLRLAVSTAEARGWNRYEGWRQGVGLACAVVSNTLSRTRLAGQFRRRLFLDPRATNPFFDGFPTEFEALQPNNVKTALLASGAIPHLIDGVTTPQGRVLRDGGVIDYHFDLGGGDGLVLYPHFSPRVIPGWFDRFLPWRKISASFRSRLVLIHPSEHFVARLPGRKIPDRKDFWALTTRERRKRWWEAVKRSQELGQEMHSLLVSPENIEIEDF